MEQYQHRRGAKVVAVFEVIFATVNLILLAASFGAAVFISTDENAKEKIRPFLEEYSTITGLDTLNIQSLGTVLWIITVSLAIGIYFPTVAAFKLLKATDIGTELEKALPKAKFWRAVTIVFATLGGIGYIFSKQIIQLVVLIVVRGIFLHFVGKYIRELEKAKEDIRRGVQCQSDPMNTPSAPGFEKV